MSAGDVLRGMTAPVSVQALQAGADALDEVPRLQATIAGLELAQADLTARLEQALAHARPVVPQTYTVQSGDYLLKIGRQFLVQVADIKAWNRLATDVIQPGQVLYMTGPAPDAEPTPEPEPEPEPEPVPAPTPGTVWSWDVSALGNDANRTEAEKISSHKALFGTDSIQNVRVFFGSSVPRWDDARIRQLTAKDSMVVSTLSRDRAGIAAWLAATPEQFRQRKGQVKLAHGHEREADLTTATALQQWLDGNREKADLLVASPWATQSEDELVKITLHFSQEAHGGTRPAHPTREQMWGGQNFGIFGEDAYNHRVWINQRNRYETPEELLGSYVAFLRQIGLPGALPELGAERASTNGGPPMDSTGEGRAKFVRDVGAYVNGLRMADGSPLIRWVNFWCADGFRDGARVLHHLEEHGPDSPEVAAYRTLVQGA